METEFNLSDCVFEIEGVGLVVGSTGVKEFIKRDSEPIEMPHGDYSPDFIEGVIWAHSHLKERRNKLAGDKLR